MAKGRIIGIAAVAVCIAAVAAFCALRASGQASDYAEAQRLEQARDTAAAYARYRVLGDYGDARERANALAAADPLLPYRVAAKGDVVQFGTWEQDGDAASGPEPVEWIVLDKVGGRLLLLCESCIDARPYNPEEFKAVTWETCELRSWLNGEFYHGAFTPDEQAVISDAENANEDRIGSEEDDEEMVDVIMENAGADELGRGGNDTVDRVFLLSETDTHIYLSGEDDRESMGKARLVEAASARDVRTGDDGDVGWWLRSPGVYGFTAQFVNEDGAPYTAGAYVELAYGVRPALWLDVSDGAGSRAQAQAGSSVDAQKEG